MTNMKLVEIIKFQTEEIFQIESPTQALIALNQLTPRELASIPKIASYKERWMTIPADLEYQIKNGMVFLVRNSVNDVVLPAVTYDKDNILKDQVFDDTTDLVHESLRINSSLPTAFKMGLKFLIKDKPTPLSARIYEANVGNSGDEQSSINSTNQSEDKDVKYNEGLSKQDEKNKDSQKNDSNNQESKEKALATKTEEEKPKDEQEKKCETCGKAYDENCPGSNDAIKLKYKVAGSSTELTKDIAKNYKDSIENHPWHYTNKRSSLEAHHLIVSEVMSNSPDVKKAAQKFGYNINHRNNGVMLPYFMELACHLAVPMHRSNHSATITDTTYSEDDKKDVDLRYAQQLVKHKKSKSDGDVFMAYPQAVAKLVRGVLENAINEEKCQFRNNENQFIKRMDDNSVMILDNISSFDWTLTSDGADYHQNSDVGCGNSNAKLTFDKRNRGIGKKKGGCCSIRSFNKDSSDGEKQYHMFPITVEANQSSKLEIGK